MFSPPVLTKIIDLLEFTRINKDIGCPVKLKKDALVIHEMEKCRYMEKHGCSFCWNTIAKSYLGSHLDVCTHVKVEKKVHSENKPYFYN